MPHLASSVRGLSRFAVCRSFRAFEAPHAICVAAEAVVEGESMGLLAVAVASGAARARALDFRRRVPDVVAFGAFFDAFRIKSGSVILKGR